MNEDPTTESAPETASPPNQVEAILSRLHEVNFQQMVAQDLVKENIQGEDRSNLERFYLAEAEATKAADPTAATNPNTYTLAYVTAKEKFRKWQNSVAKWTAVHGSDEEFKAYETKVDAARHEKQREGIRDRALANEQRATQAFERIKGATKGGDVGAMTDAEFEQYDAHRTQLRNASMVERQRLADDSWRMRERADRARREGK